MSLFMLFKLTLLLRFEDEEDTTRKASGGYTQNADLPTISV